jgi:putative ABC transport system substrate-binding protein
MQFDQMKRREFITLLGGATAAWPLAAGAQQERVRRVGVLAGSGTPDDPDVKERYAALVQRLQQLGWSEGRNLRIEAHWTASEPDDLRKRAAELVALAPDVIVAGGTSTVAPLLQATRTVPIVFAGTADPVGAGMVASLARPGGNATGFMQFEFSLSAKWPELLKQIAPSVTRAVVLRDATLSAGIGQFAVIQSAAPSVGMDVSPVNVRIAQEIEQAITAFARSPHGGLIVTASGLAAIHRDLIITLASRHKLPAVYPRRLFVAEGGLMCYGPDRIELFRQAAQYVDRILKGEKPADLPVQAPTKYELVINLRTAKALGLEVPPTLLARADEVIE